MKPDGTPVLVNGVQFRLQVRTPGAEDCLLYEEIQNADLATSNGTFAIALGDGNGVRQDSYSWSLFDALSNRKAFGGLDDCVGPSSFTPNPQDNRRFRVYFNDGTFAVGTWEALPTQVMNFTPMSIESYAVGGFPASSLLRVETAGVLGTSSPITSTQYTELMALLGGSSTQYSRPNQLNGSTLPVIGTGQSVRWTGAAWEAYTPPTNASLPTCTAGQVLFSNGSALSCVADGGGAGVSDGDDITSGTIGGTTAWNTSGNIQTSGTITATGAITGGSLSGSTVSTRDLRVYESTNTNYVSLRAPAVLTPNYTLTLPVDDGAPGEVLSTNGSGTLSWIAPSGGGGDINLSNIKSTVNAANDVFPSSACATSQTLRYSALSGQYECSELALSGNTVKLDDTGETCAAVGDAGTLRYSSSALQYCNGSSWQTLGVSGSGLTTLNGQTGSVQTFAVPGTSGTAPNWSSASDAHTLNIPMASASGSVTAGLLSNAEYAALNSKLSAVGGSALSSGQIWIGDGSNQAAAVTPSGDATISNTGVIALKNTGTAGTYTKVTTDAQGRVTASAALALSDLPTGVVLDGGNTTGATVTVGTNDAEDLSLRTNGVSRLRIADDGEITVGTADLEVARANANATIYVGNTNSSSSQFPGVQIYNYIGSASGGFPELRLVNRRGNSGGPLAIEEGDVLGQIRLSGSWNNSWSLSSGALIRSTAEQDFNATDGGANIGFFTSDLGNDTPTEKLRVTANGKIGIGTTDPWGQLHVKQATASSGSIFYPLAIQSSSISEPSSARIKFVTSSSATDGVSAYIGAERKLSGSGSAHLVFGTGQDGAGVGSESERMRITQEGNVGIGTTEPSAKLDVAGAIQISDNSEACSAAGDAGTIRYNSGTLQYCNGSSWQTLGVSGSGLTSLNAQTGGIQTFGTPGSTGNAPNWSSASNVHTLNIPMASASGSVTAGLLSNTEYAALNAKLSAVAGSALAEHQVWVGNGSNQAAARYIGLADIRTSGGSQQIPTACTASQTMTWSALTDVLTCTDIAIAHTKVSGLGTVATLDTGTTSGTIPVIGAGDRLPASIIPPAATPISTKTSDYTATSGDHTILVDATSAARSITLPTAVGDAGRQYTIKKVDGGSNKVTVLTSSSQTIDGSADYELSEQWEFVTLTSDGANWLITGVSSLGVQNNIAATFSNVTGAITSTLITSTTVTVTGTGSGLISVTGDGSPQISINGAAWGTGGAIAAGQTLAIRLTASALATTTSTATITGAKNPITWTVTTAACDSTPSVFLGSGSYVVPTSCTGVIVKAWGAGGSSGYYYSTTGTGGAGGGGGFIKSTIPAIAGETLEVTVGAGATNYTGASPGGGNAGGGSNNYQSGGGGGGYSRVRRSTTTLIAAGGGGGGGSGYGHTHGGAEGGGGGYPSGSAGGPSYEGSYSSGGGGTSSAGGAAGVSYSGSATAGSSFQGGNGAAGNSRGGGGGGGGYYGGGGGGGGYSNQGGRGGGGGSSYATGTSIFFENASGTVPGGTTDEHYSSGIGVGGATATAAGFNAGGSGKIVIIPIP